MRVMRHMMHIHLHIRCTYSLMLLGRLKLDDSRRSSHMSTLLSPPTYVVNQLLKLPMEPQRAFWKPSTG